MSQLRPGTTLLGDVFELVFDGVSFPKRRDRMRERTRIRVVTLENMYATPKSLSDTGEDRTARQASPCE